MNDRFLFRAFYEGRFIYKNLIDANYYTYDNKCIGLANTSPNSLKWEQCTGLKDKNGKLIYEGDIVITYYAGEPTGQTYIYRWKDPTFYVEPFEKGKPSGIHYYYFAVANERCEIIGNVHENPELLESEER